MSQISNDPVASAIYAHYERLAEHEEQRTYLGASIIGKECARALWYDFRMCGREQFNGRMLRLFDTGHRAESRFVYELRSIGCEIHEHDQNGQQFSITAVHGHVRGHMDSVARNVPQGGKEWHVCEFKTHNAKSFADLVKNGVQKAKPMHFAQMQVYMGTTGMQRALYLAENKDTSELYSERVHFDLVEYERLLSRATGVIFADVPPTRISDNPTWYQCKQCSHHAICHEAKTPAVNCRTCCHSTPTKTGDGSWECVKFKQAIPVHIQRKGCDGHLHIPVLVQFATPIDAGDSWILYQRNDNQAVFAVGMPPAELMAERHPIIYTSKELATGSALITDDPFLRELKERFDARVTA